MIGVIGAGAFGTALANSLARGGSDVRLWGRREKDIEAINAQHENPRYLPGIKLHEKLRATARLEDLANAEAILLATPAQSLRAILSDVKSANLPRNFILCAKGIEQETGLLQSQIVSDVIGEARISVLSGPGFAQELAMGKPTALSLACNSPELGAELQEKLSSETLRLYLSEDVKGVQLGGALKNVIAIGCGILMGAALGESARAAVITRGYAEMTKLAVAMGAEPKTLTGLSGFGDLVLTATSEQSRNYAFGLKVGATGNLDTGKTVEGIATARALVTLADKNNVDMPIARTVAEVLSKKLTAQEALIGLMTRPLRSEID